jgi:hypothetical protein
MRILDRASRCADNRDVRALAIVLVLGAAAAGCKKSGAGASCDAVGIRFQTIAEADLKLDNGVDAQEREAVRALVAPMRDAMVKSCRENGWSADARACMAAADDEAKFRACEAKLSGEQRALLTQAAAKGIQPRR